MAQEQGVLRKFLSDNAFFRFLRGKKGSWKIAVLLIVGLFLLLIGTQGFAEKDSVKETEDESQRLAALCEAVEGVGECKVMITYSSVTTGYKATAQKVESVCVVCDGADKIEVRKNLTELLSSLYGIGTNRIYIAKLR